MPDFLKLLERSRLLSQVELEQWKSTAARESNGHSANGRSKREVLELARSIVESGQLTAFQARHLLHGDADGLILGEHRLCEPISRGGMGRVFLVEHLASGEQRAMKILRNSRIRALSLARFRLEALVCRTIEHPNVARGLAFDSTGDNTWYLLMELVAGPNLREYRAIRKSIEWSEACSIARMAALGLQAAHDFGIVHRDVKPQNILLAPSGDAKVIDFGLALYQGDDPSYISLPTSRAGTDEFIAPEQVLGDASLDHRADIYSLGCSLFFAIAGRAPFPAATKRERRLAHLRQAPPRLKDLVADVPEDIEQLIQAMLAKSPDQRPGSMREVAEALAVHQRRRRSIKIDYSALLRARNRRRANLGLSSAYMSSEEAPDSQEERPRDASPLPADTLEALVTSLSHTLRQQREETGALRRALSERDSQHREALKESRADCERQSKRLAELGTRLNELETQLEQERSVRQSAEQLLQARDEQLKRLREEGAAATDSLETWKTRFQEAERRARLSKSASDLAEKQLSLLRQHLQQLTRTAQELTDELADLGSDCGEGDLADHALRRAYETECPDAAAADDLEGGPAP